MIAAARRRWLIAGTVAWAVGLTALAIVSSRGDEPTVRDQRSVAQTQPVVGRVVGELLAATGPEAVAELTALRSAGSCRITPVRDGIRLEQGVAVRVRPGQGPALLESVRAALPVAYRPRVIPVRDATPVLTADAGDFIAVNGGIESGGAVVRLVAATGCRPLDGASLPPAPAANPGPELAPVLAAVGLPATAPATSEQVTCPSGGIARTVAVRASASLPDLGTALRPLAEGANVVQAEPAAYAYRRDGHSIVVTSVDGVIRATETTGCP